MYLEKHRKTIERAYMARSFDPEKRADSIITEYSEEMESDIQVMANCLNFDKEKYLEKYEDKIMNWIHSSQRVMNPMITGPANFPVNRNRKAMDSEQNRYNEFRTWRERYIKAMFREKPLSAEEELEKVKNKLSRAKVFQEQMKKANIIFRKNLPEKETIDLIKKSGIQDWVYNQKCENKFKTFQLNNNRQKIKYLEDRIIAIESRIERKKTFDRQYFKGGYVDIVEDRVVIIFDTKPDSPTRTTLKEKGFKWSPKNMRWQRKSTRNAINDALHIAGKNI